MAKRVKLKQDKYLNTSSIVHNNKKLSNILDEQSNNINRIGKLLWSGNFTNGSITVPELSNYSLIAVSVDSVLCVGNKHYGGGGYVASESLNVIGTAYRFTANGDTLTIDARNKGGSQAGVQCPVVAIYGIF